MSKRKMNPSAEEKVNIVEKYLNREIGLSQITTEENANLVTLR